MRNKRTLIVCATLLAAYGLAGFFALPPILKPRLHEFRRPDFEPELHDRHSAIAGLGVRALLPGAGPGKIDPARIFLQEVDTGTQAQEHSVRVTMTLTAR